MVATTRLQVTILIQIAFLQTEEGLKMSDLTFLPRRENSPVSSYDRRFAMFTLKYKRINICNQWKAGTACMV